MPTPRAISSVAGSCRRWTWPGATSPITAPAGAWQLSRSSSISFLVPVAIGDEVSCYAEVTRVGRSSLSTHIEVWTRRRAGEERMKVTEGTFTYVAIDDTGRPRPVPKV